MFMAVPDRISKKIPLYRKVIVRSSIGLDNFTFVGGSDIPSRDETLKHIHHTPSDSIIRFLSSGLDLSVAKRDWFGLEYNKVHARYRDKRCQRRLQGVRVSKKSNYC
jgi:hypothetical protein